MRWRWVSGRCQGQGEMEMGDRKVPRAGEMETGVRKVPRAG